MEGVRVCVYKSNLFEVNKITGDPNRDEMFKGALAYLMNENIAVLLRRGVKTIEIIEMDSSVNCIEGMMKNQSDVLLSSAPYGEQDFDTIYPFDVPKEMKFTIFSAYNATSVDTIKFTDICITAFQKMSYDVVATLIFLLFTFYILLNLSSWIKSVAKFGYRQCSRCRRRRRFRLRYGFEICAHFIKYGSLEFSDGPRRLISFILVMTSFFTLTLIACFLSTQLVSVEEPTLITTYDDVISRPYLQIGCRQLIKVTLESAGPNSRNAKFLKSVQNRLFIDDGNPKTAVQQILDMFAGKLVIVFYNMADEGVRKVKCMLHPLVGEKMKEFTAYPYYSHDPNAEFIQMANIMTQSFRHSFAGQAVIRNWRRATEGGVLDPGARHRMEYKIPKNEILEKGAYYHKCMSARVVKPEIPDIQVVKMINLKSLYKILALSTFCTFEILIIEILCKFFVQRRTSAKPQMNKTGTRSRLRAGHKKQ